MRKTDNHNINAKLGIRRHILDRFGDRELDVLDCFSGKDESIWSVLKNEYRVKRYTALDVKAKQRRLKIDSAKYLAGEKWEHNVIDLDAYGSPWKHWELVLKRRLDGDASVFLTIGSTFFGVLSSESLGMLGIPKETPKGIHKSLGKDIVEYFLGIAERFGSRVVEAYESLNPGGNARYLGVILKKINDENI